MSFRIVFSPKSSKMIKSLDPELKERIRNAIQEIRLDPWEKGTIKVKGHGDVRRNLHDIMSPMRMKMGKGYLSSIRICNYEASDPGRLLFGGWYQPRERN